MRVAGLGFRGRASAGSLRDAIARAGGAPDLLATSELKAAEAVVQDLARDLGLRLVPVPGDSLAAQVTLTRSARVAARFGTGSLAEAAALAAAGPGARLLGPRAVSEDGLATAAIAERT